MSDELGNILDQPGIEQARRTIDLELITSNGDGQEGPHLQLKHLVDVTALARLVSG